jgi:hypothetical protein
MRTTLTITGALLLAGCGNNAPPPPPPAPATLPAGEWEVSAKVTSLDGKAKDAAAIKVGDVLTARACVAADGVAPPALFAAEGDSCEAQSPYVRNGRLNMQMTCKRKGGVNVMATVAGTYTPDSIKGDSRSTAYVSGMDNYVVKQDLSGRRIGECKEAKTAGL